MVTYKVHRGVNGTDVLRIKITGTEKTGGKLTHFSLISAPEGSYSITVSVILFTPLGRELSDSVAETADIPRLTDKNALINYRICMTGLKEGTMSFKRVEHIRCGFSGHSDRKVETEAVNLHLSKPVTHRIKNNSQSRLT